MGRASRHIVPSRAQGAGCGRLFSSRSFFFGGHFCSGVDSSSFVDNNVSSNVSSRGFFNHGLDNCGFFSRSFFGRGFATSGEGQREGKGGNESDLLHDSVFLYAVIGVALK